jgi:hypothetical protein
MNEVEAGRLIPILMKSPLYVHRDREQKIRLISRLVINNPYLSDDRGDAVDEKVGVLHKPNGSGIFSDTSE